MPWTSKTSWKDDATQALADYIPLLGQEHDTMGAGARVTRVFPESPAYLAGIREGWELVKFNDRPPAENIFLMGPQEEKVFSTIFRDPEGRLFLWGLASWPFGIKLSPPVNAGLLRKIEKSLISHDVLVDYWRDGNLDAIGRMNQSLRKGIERELGVGLLGRLRGAQKKLDLSRYQKDFHLGFLALAELQAGNAQAAEQVLRAARKAKSGNEWVSSIEMGLFDYIEARINLANNDNEAAKYAAQAAYELVPDIGVVRDLLRQLAPESEVAEISEEQDQDPFVGKKLPLDYVLPGIDPVGNMGGKREMISLSRALKNTADNQVFALLVMGQYRANGYSLMDLFKMAMVHAAYPDLISGVHIISAGDRVANEQDRETIETICTEKGLPFKVLFDGEDFVSPELPMQGSPMRIMVDNKGTVLSTREMADESGIWEAVANLKAT